jgi:hypothetical protein
MKPKKDDIDDWFYLEYYFIMIMVSKKFINYSFFENMVRGQKGPRGQ